MPDPNHADFSDRIRRIDRQHRRMGGAYVELVERDGLLVPKHARRRRRGGFPLRGLVIALIGFVVFKGFLLAQLGSITYESRLEKLRSGAVPEQVAAWVMHADPAASWIARQLGRVI